MGDDAAIFKWKLSRRTLTNYRRYINPGDPAYRVEIAKRYAKRMRMIDEDWKTDALRTYRNGLQTLNTLFDTVRKDPKPVNHLHSVTQAVKGIGEQLIADSVLSDGGEDADPYGVFGDSEDAPGGAGGDGAAPDWENEWAE